MCEEPTIPSNGAMTSTGSIAVFACDAGYTISGSSATTCGTNGEGWLSTSPTCGKFLQECQSTCYNYLKTLVQSFYN